MKKDLRLKRIFLVKIIITDWGWDYKINDEIIIPVLSNSKINAENKVDDVCCGSEYPSYIVKEVTECDQFLFRPII